MPQAAARAVELGTAFDRGQTAMIACYLHTFLRDMEALARSAEAAAVVGDEYGFPMVRAVATVGRGRVLVARGEYDAGIAAMRQGIDAYRVGRHAVALPALLTLLAEAHGEAGCLEDALVLLAQARALVESTGELRFEAEIQRLEGEVRRRRGEPQAAERCFRRAIEVARKQGARWWELRAHMSLARWRQQRGQRAAARRALAPVVGAFTEGLDTTDVREAQALLAELS